MRYHDMKLRDAGKMAVIGAAIAAVLTLMLLYRSLFSQRFLDGPYVPLIVALAVSALLPVAVIIWYFATTPAQNARFLEKHKRRAPEDVDWTLFDASDPHFHVTTWQYLRRRRTAGR